ncbi:hypothetical protein RHECNPAF_2530024 [Rhizobium etli CNPAF512]|nr:hypothetical protein RHECNPAF_2530024 [Rhizobium etli CNPAF512]
MTVGHRRISRPRAPPLVIAVADDALVIGCTAFIVVSGSFPDGRTLASADQESVKHWLRLPILPAS